MKLELVIRKIENHETDVIQKIARWYNGEWQTPFEKTFERLHNHPNDKVLFHLVLSKDKAIVATGGLYHDVGLLHVYPEFKKFDPWVAMVYTDESYRKQGFAEIIVNQIETEARALGYKKIYLYTFSAESLYAKLGWKTFDERSYKGHRTVIMEKEI